MKDKIFLALISYLYKRHKYVLPNAFFGFMECDVFSLTQSDYKYEFEVKVSRSDFFADKKKEEKHKRYNDAFKNKNITYGFIPNRFFYVCPEGMIKIEELPPWAGLVYLNKINTLDFIKNAPLIHKEKATDEIYKQIADKCYFRYMYKYHNFKAIDKLIDKQEIDNPFIV